VRRKMPSNETPGAAAGEQPPRRADALRNVETILAAAERCLARDPDASMSDIAAEAGLGRITVYGHFKSRAELVEVVVRRVLDDANEVLSVVDLSGGARAALARLVEASWEVTVRSGSLLVAAEKELAPEVVREAHAGKLEDRVRNFLAAGQRAGAFRSDLPTAWLVAVFHATLHAAANEIAAGRLDAAKAAGVITATLLGAYQTPRTKPKPKPRRPTTKAARRA
jgi:TetR/AcrR family transcriptional repressor of mexCD-oprJ operon